MSKFQLWMVNSEGEKIAPITDRALNVLYDTLPEDTSDTVGAKLLVGMCLHGSNTPESQRLAHAALKFTDTENVGAST
jgi:hypothetical protein